ncbi:MAG: PTS glucose transporter subunit IIA [Alkalibacterium sp.]|nr:PTS glucose transporter subunit IIA [Alkalibacterium sp.]TVP90818.1 MAG: PTS glucose transporter subunit IIA [Alkalibacterium sp.]
MSNQSDEFGVHEESGSQSADYFTVFAVTDGEVISIEEVPDDLFSQRMIGDGFAMMPSSEVVYAPVSGKLIEVADAKHAYYIETEEGIKVLIHIGIDTLLLNGEGFESFVKKGMTVDKGQKLARFDRQLFEDRGFHPVIPVIVLEHPTVKSLELHSDRKAVANETVALVVHLEE